YFSGANRNKRSITADLSKPDAQAMVRTLAAKCDVVIENYKVGGLAKYGLDWASLSKTHPALVYCSITGFGQTGPWATRPGYDAIIQGIGGLMSVTGERDDLPGGGPQKVGVAVADLMTGLYATIAILAALAHRDRTGEGQHIDMALLDTQVAMMANVGMNWLASGVVPQRIGNANPNIVPYQTFATADGHLILAVGNDAQFHRMCEVAGCPELATDPRYATNPARVEHRDTLVPLLATRFRQRTLTDWIDALEAAGVPCGPINTLDRTFAEPQAVARGLKVRMPHPTAGAVDLIASPIRLSATPVAYRRAPPLLGEHTDEVLRDVLGLDPARVAALRATGAI
nr:CoA transferase [Burkholderiales bacterium]